MAEHQRFNYNLTGPVEREVIDADEFDAFIALERARRYQMAMRQPARMAPHDDEPFELAREPAEIGELRKEMAQLRQEMAQLRSQPSPQSVMDSLRLTAALLKIQITQLRQEVDRLRGELEQGVADAIKSVSVLHEELQGTKSVAEKSFREAALTDVGTGAKISALERAVDDLRKQLQAVKQEVSDSAKSSGSRPQEPSAARDVPPRSLPRYQPSDSKPYRYASDIEYMMRQTPRAISEWEKPYDPYRDRD
ncbi:hypothetical protein ACFYM3_16250 [Streptomyces massasporeus]|uniref:Chromosome partition protein Smc n=1 Tax=Streptomyces massasporeus TaxID=67324 RepID=A0ABW6LCI6_9ACTN